MPSPTTDVRPPLSNRGVNLPADVLHWDWYQATLTDVPDLLALLTALGGSGKWIPTKALYGYRLGYRLDGVPAGSVQVFTREADVHVQATSVAAVRVAAILRERWPSHTVSRADVALDVDQPGAFDRLYRQVHGLAREGAASGGRKVSTATAGDWLDGEQGRTFYAGGASSALRVVVYEKGHEQRAKDPACGASLDWARVEWRLRPDTPEGKAWLARATCAEAVGLTRFGAAVGTALLGGDIPQGPARLRFSSQDPGYWMARQYGAVVDELLGLDPLDMALRLAGWRDLARGSVLAE